MPYNPERATRGGDVEGTALTDVDDAVGAPIRVAEASYEAGYECQDVTEEAGYVTRADIIRGYSSYGVGVGERRPKQMIGGR